MASLTASSFHAYSSMKPQCPGRNRMAARILPSPRAGSGVRLAHRTLTRAELDVLASAKNGRRICGCPDRACCPHGYKSMLEDPRAHTARQLFKTITDLEAVPDLRRETYFIDGQLREADQKARAVKALRPDSSEAARHKLNVENLMKRLDDHSRKVEKFRTTLENLHERRGPTHPEPACRNSGARER